MPKHVHAESMMLYAIDAYKTEKPWELWERRTNPKYQKDSIDWAPCTENTWFWNPLVEYRRTNEKIT